MTQDKEVSGYIGIDLATGPDKAVVICWGCNRVRDYESDMDFKCPHCSKHCIEMPNATTGTEE